MLKPGLVLLAVVLALPLHAQTPDFEALGRASWPGMTAWDAAWCRDLVFLAGFVEVRNQNGSRTVWVMDARGWRKPNGYYGLKINGEIVDEAEIWIDYGGSMTNLRVLFTYGSDPVKDVSPFRD